MDTVVELIQKWEYSVSFILMAVFMGVLIVGLVVGIILMVAGAWRPWDEYNQVKREEQEMWERVTGRKGGWKK